MNAGKGLNIIVTGLGLNEIARNHKRIHESGTMIIVTPRLRQKRKPIAKNVLRSGRVKMMPKYPKSCPNVPFDGVTCIRYDAEYYYNKVTFTVIGEEDLWVRFCCADNMEENVMRSNIECDVPHYFCGDCVHWNFRGPCKGLDHNSIRFAAPYFKSYDAGQHSGIICSKFQPYIGLYAFTQWTNFEDFWPKYVECWIPYADVNILMWFVLHNDTKMRYGVPLMDYVNVTMIENGFLKAVQKYYYKHSKNNHRLVYEKINGVRIQALDIIDANVSAAVEKKIL
jgi:hypothetical protein